MPGGDRTGPEGRGPLTGQRAGFCVCGRGQGRGGGGGHGWRNVYRGTGVPGRARGPAWDTSDAGTAADEQRYLQERTKALQQEIVDIRLRLDELEDESRRYCGG